MKQSLQHQIKSWQELDKDELYQLLQLRAQVFVVEQNCAYQDLDDEDVNAQHLLMRSAEGESLVAYARIYGTEFEGEPFAAIGRVCTDKNYRGQGMARSLMEAAMVYIEREMQLPITVSAQAYLETFYASLGFKTVSEPYLEDGIPHIRMVRKQ